MVSSRLADKHPWPQPGELQGQVAGRRSLPWTEEGGLVGLLDMRIPSMDYRVSFDDLQPLHEGRYVPRALGPSPGVTPS